MFHTVMAMSIELKPEPAEILYEGHLQEHYNLLQNMIKIVQTQVYRMEGSVTKVMAYEGGLIITAAWGMQFLSHEDDSSRAVFAALNIKKHLTMF